MAKVDGVALDTAAGALLAAARGARQRVVWLQHWGSAAASTRASTEPCHASGDNGRDVGKLGSQPE